MFPTRLEIIPSEGIVEKVAAAVPLDTTLSITCLPHHGIGRTMRVAVELAQLGYTVVPHLAARALQERPQLVGILRDCDAAGIREVFAIGGDSQRAAGPYGTAGELMEDITQYTGGGISIGVAGYPEGHPSVGGLDLLDALLAKQHLASRIVTQMCFSAPKIVDYVGLLRREGVELPVWAGVPGAVPRTKLVALGTQIGVGASLKFLSRKGPLARRLLSGERYQPASLISELAEHPGRIAGIHFYTFNHLTAATDGATPAPGPAATVLASISGAAK
ncbi:methylenetetrahydrofolate reductase [Arthrobacter sp. PsM3]|uniref:methylenetetrahydrofolate reductase n=1 Tax=Arthrobacter sp. PsM3 TaxID=3030531 RepID=UPI00263B0F6D|nr:methylenetetrahydrofolate reductase [Arthrobacter sp. PsM3]MDN4646525.1 methylenetetrahydrofolate reductase [Arthrobacter sp. PsM3]